MLADRALKVASDLAKDYDGLKVREMHQKAAGVAQIRGAPNYPNEANAVVQLCLGIEAGSVFNNYPLDILQSYQGSPFGYLMSVAIAKRLRAGFTGESSSHIASGEINQLFHAANTLYTNVSGYINFSKSLGITQGQIRDGFVSLDLILPDEVFGSQLNQLGEEYKQFDRLFQVISEVSGGERSGPIVYKSSSSTLATALIFVQDHYIAAIFAYSKIIDAAQKTVQFYKSVIDLKSSKAPASVIKTVEDSKDGVAESHLDDAVNEIMNSIKIDIDDGRRNELRNEVSIAARHAIHSAINGARLRLSIENYTGTNMKSLEGVDIGGEPALQIFQKMKQIEGNINAIREGNQQEIKALTSRPDPKPSENT